MAIRQTAGDVLRINNNQGPGFHMLRHVLALAILTLHVWLALRGPHQAAAGAGATAAGLIADHTISYSRLATELIRPALFSMVAMFFALSGFLVTGSALRKSDVKTFFLNRAFRILPALSVEVTLSALILGPLVTLWPLHTYFGSPLFLSYFGNIVGHIHFELPGVFLTNPWPNRVNASLWTLPAELWCYVIMLLCMVTGTLLYTKRLTIGVLVVLFIVTIIFVYDPLRFPVKANFTHFTEGYIVLMFLFGALAAVERDRIILDRWLFLACALGYYVIMISDTLLPLSGLFLTYCVVYIGLTAFPRFDRLLPQDLSYGIYLYSFPITQGVIYGLLPAIHRYGSTKSMMFVLPIVTVTTLSFAALSWRFIEKPALRLRHRFVWQV